MNNNEDNKPAENLNGILEGCSDLIDKHHRPLLDEMSRQFRLVRRVKKVDEGEPT